MKSERRHELQKNELADWLGERLEMLLPHAQAIALGGVILAVLILGSIWYFTGEDRASAEAWSSYFRAFNQREPTKALEQITKDKPGTVTALWALEAMGDMDVAQGGALLFSDRTEAQKLLEKAEAAYKQVDAAATDPILKARTRLGLGKVYESRCQPDEARKYYEMVAESQKGTALGKAAAANANRLKDERQVALLAWFAQQTPKKAAPIPGVGSSPPSLPSDVPSQPDIAPPGGLGLGKIGSESPAAPAPTFPEPAKATPETKSASPEESKGDKKAAKEKPAEGQPGEPAAEKKVDDAKPGS